MERSYLEYSVIMHVRDEEKNLKYALDSIARQTVQPANIYIVNDGSVNGTQKLIENSHCKWVTIHQSPDMPKYARRSNAFNVAVEAAIQADPGIPYLLKVDGDIQLGDSYAEKLLESIQQPYMAAVSGVTNKTLKTRDLNNGAVLYRADVLPRAQPIYGWDREIQLDLVRAGYFFMVDTRVYYSEMRLATVKSPGLRRVAVNRIRSRVAAVQGFFARKKFTHLV